MHKLLLIILALLLPLRGLAVEAMVYQDSISATKSLAAQVNFENKILLTVDKAFDATAKKLPCHASFDPTETSDSAQNQCSTCQACHSGALTDTTRVISLQPNQTVAPAQRASQWHSAELRLLAKTPVF